MNNNALDPDNYSLSEYMRLMSRAKTLEASLAGMLVSVGTRVDEQGVTIESATYELTGEVADDMRRFVDDKTLPVIVRSEVGFWPKVEDMTIVPDSKWTYKLLSIGVGNFGRRFGKNGYQEVNLFEHIVEWLDEELKRKDWIEAGHAGALFDGAL